MNGLAVLVVGTLSTDLTITPDLGAKTYKRITSRPTDTALQQSADSVLLRHGWTRTGPWTHDPDLPIPVWSAPVTDRR